MKKTGDLQKKKMQFFNFCPWLSFDGISTRWGDVGQITNSISQYFPQKVFKNARKMRFQLSIEMFKHDIRREKKKAHTLFLMKMVSINGQRNSQKKNTLLVQLYDFAQEWFD